MVVRAVAPISAGQEVTFSYVAYGTTPWERREKLQRGWGFSCSCCACQEFEQLPRASQLKLQALLRRFEREIRPAARKALDGSRGASQVATQVGFFEGRGRCSKGKEGRMKSKGCRKEGKDGEEWKGK